jgi:serine/threonine protein phosphatase PrpC
VVKGVYDFIGTRRFAGVARQSSVRFMDVAEHLIANAKDGREAQKAKVLSYQFQNLGRGASFAKTQNQKWLTSDNPLKEDEIQLIESIAHDTMAKFGYKCHLVGMTTEPTMFTEEDIKKFDRLNQEGIQEMNENLKEDNPGDWERRQIQAEVLGFAPTLIRITARKRASMLEIFDGRASISKTPAQRAYPYAWPMGSEKAARYLSSAEVRARFDYEAEESALLANGTRICWAVASQRGYYPTSPDKPNQDAFKIDCDGRIHCFSVFDGHGPAGHDCSAFASRAVSETVEKEMARGQTMGQAIRAAFQETNTALASDKSIDDSQSGTTAVSVCLYNNKCVVGNLGDSRCILGSHGADGKLVAKPLSSDQDLKRADERERITKAGGVIMTTSEQDGRPPDEGEPHRIWASSVDKYPGAAFTRSIGDTVAESLGVFADPEIMEYKLGQEDSIVIIGSDGITECKYGSSGGPCNLFTSNQANTMHLSKQSWMIQRW